jgi:hypothetical protein
MKQAIEQLEQAKLFIQNIETRGNHAYLDRENAKACVERAIARLKDSLCWETPEQREKRTGEKWPKKGAVYYRVYKLYASDFDGAWGVCRYETAQRYRDICVVATEAGPPPDDWVPESVAEGVSQRREYVVRKRSISAMSPVEEDSLFFVVYEVQPDGGEKIAAVFEEWDDAQLFALEKEKAEVK